MSPGCQGSEQGSWTLPESAESRGGQALRIVGVWSEVTRSSLITLFFKFSCTTQQATEWKKLGRQSSCLLLSLPCDAHVTGLFFSLAQFLYAKISPPGTDSPYVPLSQLPASLQTDLQCLDILPKSSSSKFFLSFLELASLCSWNWLPIAASALSQALEPNQVLRRGVNNPRGLEGGGRRMVNSKLASAI